MKNISVRCLQHTQSIIKSPSSAMIFFPDKCDTTFRCWTLSKSEGELRKDEKEMTSICEGAMETRAGGKEVSMIKFSGKKKLIFGKEIFS